MTYYLIITWEEGATHGWAPQFGDNDHELVKEERLDQYVKQRGYAYEGDGKVIAKHCKIIRFPRVPSQRQIMEACANQLPPE